MSVNKSCDIGLFLQTLCLKQIESHLPLFVSLPIEILLLVATIYTIGLLCELHVADILHKIVKKYRLTAEVAGATVLALGNSICLP